MRVTIEPSSRAGYKYMASDGSRTTHFGAKGYEDYTTHRDEKRRRNYLSRHESREDWGRSGVMTAGWLSRYILWEKPTIKEAVAAANRLYPDVTFALAAR
jgi:hypothetical protein